MANVKNLILRFSMSGQNSVKATMDQVQRKKKDLSGSSVSINIGANDAEANTKISHVFRQIEALNRSKATVRMKLDGADAAEKQLDEIYAKARLIGATVIRPKIAIDKKGGASLAFGLAAKTPQIPGGGPGGGAGGKGASGLLSALPAAQGMINPYTIVAGLAALPFAAQAAAGGITLAMGGAFAAIAAIGARKSKSVQNSFKELKKSANADLVKIGKPFVPVMNSIISTVSGLMTHLTPVFVGISKTIGGPFKDFANTFIKAFGQPAVAASLKSMAAGFVAILKALTPQLPADIKAVADGFNRVGMAIQRNPKAIADMISAMIHLIGWTLDLISVLANVANYIEQHFGPAMHRIAVIFDGVRHEVAHIWDMIFQDTVGWQIRIGHNVEAGFNAMRHKVASTFDGMRHNISHYWDLIWSNTTGRVIRGVRDVVNWFRSMPGRINSALGNVGSLLYNKGKAVIQGFWNGLTYIWHKVTGWISGIAGWIKNHKGPISLDAKLLIPAGKAIMGGFLHGLTHGWGSVTGFLGGVAGKVGGFFSGLFGGGGANQGAMAALKMAAGAHGWGSGAQWDALNYVEMREAGYNIHATNPSSGAYGMAQFINGPAEYAQYGGNANTAWGQAIGMTNYIAQRYGSPLAAAMHERMFNWYAMGTNSAHPGWAVVGERGPELVNFGGGEKVIPNNRLGGGVYIEHLTVEVKGQSLHTKAEIGNAVLEAAKYAKRHGNGGSL